MVSRAKRADGALTQGRADSVCSAKQATGDG